MDSFLSSPQWAPTPPRSQSEEWTNTLTHGFGLLLSLGGTVVLCFQAMASENGKLLVGSVVYSISLVILPFPSEKGRDLANEPDKLSELDGSFRLIEMAAFGLSFDR